MTQEEKFRNAHVDRLAEHGAKRHQRGPITFKSVIQQVEEAVKGDDKEAIDEAAKVLSEASSGLAQKMYAEQADAGQAQQGGEQAPGDDAMDAEFEEVKEDAAEENKDSK